MIRATFCRHRFKQHLIHAKPIHIDHFKAISGPMEVAAGIGDATQHKYDSPRVDGSWLN